MAELFQNSKQVVVYRWVIGGMAAFLLILFGFREAYIFGRLEAMDAKIQAMQDHLFRAFEKK